MTVTTLAVLLAICGLTIGPALGVIVDRAVDRVRLAPEHRCARCETALGWQSLIPLRSWFQRCGSCGRHKGWRYPAVDVTTAVVFLLLGHRFGADWDVLAYLGLAAVVIVLSVIDLETHLLPNIVMWPSIWTGLFLVLVLSGESGDGERLYAALLGGAVFGGFIGAAHLAYEQGMGRGDVKLGLLLGLFVGWLQPDSLVAVRLVLYALFLALLGGGLVGLAANAVRRKRSEIPFGPALASAALVVILLSPALETQR